MPLVLRIEDKDGLGPYKWQQKLDMSKELRTILNSHDECFMHPNPYNEFSSLLSMDDYYCAFIDRKQLSNWFNQKTIELLNEHGYFIKLINCKSIQYVGYYQVLIEK